MKQFLVSLFVLLAMPVAVLLGAWKLIGSEPVEPRPAMLTLPDFQAPTCRERTPHRCLACHAGGINSRGWEHLPWCPK